jgi:hypothetical protein
MMSQMKRLDHRTVELTDIEIVAHALMGDWLSEGLHTPAAVAKVREEYGDKLTEAYYQYLGH